MSTMMVGVFGGSVTVNVEVEDDLVVVLNVDELIEVIEVVGVVELVEAKVVEVTGATCCTVMLTGLPEGK